MTTKIYHTILTREDGHSPWEIHNGFWDRDDALGEAVCAREMGYRKSDVKIIQTDGRQSQIDEVVAHLNGKG